jgi:CHAD domain-containing protein
VAKTKAKPKPNPKTDESFPLLQREDELVDELRENVPKALKEFDEEAIHQARVATRRLKAALELTGPVLPKDQHKPFSRALRKLRRRLGPLRDLDVMIGHLQAMSKQKTSHGAIVWLLGRLEQARVDARKMDAKESSPGRVLARLGTWWGVRDATASVREAIDSLLAEALHLQLDSFAEQADQLVARTTSQTVAVLDEEPNDPHALRIAGKSLRYTLEMAQAEGHDLPRKVMKAFKRMQESLGQWHDYVVLSERAMQESLAALLPHHDAALQNEVLDLAKSFLRRASKHLAEFATLWSERGAELSAAVRSHFPLSRPVAPVAEPVTAPKTDPDPPGSAEPAIQEVPAPDAVSNG